MVCFGVVGFYGTLTLIGYLMTNPVYAYKSKIKVGDRSRQKAPFWIVTTPRSRRGRYTFPWFAPLHSWYLPYNAEQEGIKYNSLEFLVWLDLGLNSSLPGHWRTLYPPIQQSVTLFVNIFWWFFFKWARVHFYLLLFYTNNKKLKLSPFSRGRPEVSLFNSYYTEV